MTPSLLATCAGPMLLDFGDASIQALRDGRKTETRTVINWVRGIGKVTEFQPSDTRGYDWIMRDRHLRWNDLRDLDLRERLRYQPGKRYYVAETWAHVSGNDGEPAYRADGEIPTARWRPSTSMPRWAARYVVEVTGSRVERLAEATEDGARAEGMLYHDGLGVGHSGWRHSESHEFVCATAREAFAKAWVYAHHKRDQWASNPFVEVTTFRLVKG